MSYTWVLILFAYAGPLSDNDSMAMTTTSGFSKTACVAAGEQAKRLASGTTKVIRYECVDMNK